MTFSFGLLGLVCINMVEGKVKELLVTLLEISGSIWIYNLQQVKINVVLTIDSRETVAQEMPIFR